MPRDDATLLDIVNAARLIQTFIQDMTQEAFLGGHVFHVPAELVTERSHQLHRVKSLRLHLATAPRVIGSPGGDSRHGD
jgi:hypothetical protein